MIHFDFELVSMISDVAGKNKNPFVKSPILTKLILIGYYKMNDIEQVKEYILSLEAIDYDKSPAVGKIAKELNVSYDPKKIEEDVDDKDF